MDAWGTVWQQETSKHDCQQLRFFSYRYQEKVEGGKSMIEILVNIFVIPTANIKPGTAYPIDSKSLNDWDKPKDLTI